MTSTSDFTIDPTNHVRLSCLCGWRGTHRDRTPTRHLGGIVSAWWCACGRLLLTHITDTGEAWRYIKENPAVIDDAPIALLQQVLPAIARSMGAP